VPLIGSVVIDELKSERAFVTLGGVGHEVMAENDQSIQTKQSISGHHIEYSSTIYKELRILWGS
jgi:hypothetical protein